MKKIRQINRGCIREKGVTPRQVHSRVTFDSDVREVDLDTQMSALNTVLLTTLRKTSDP